MRILILSLLVLCFSTAFSQTAKEYSNRGITKIELGDYSGAIADFDKAIELDSNYAGAYINRGTAKSELQDLIGAITDYNKAIELDPNFAIAYINRGLNKYKQKDNFFTNFKIMTFSRFYVFNHSNFVKCL